MALAQHRERIVPRLIEEEMRESFLDYSMSVIVQRALPDVRDGLKPVHRRILYSMYELGLLPERPHKKSAAVVGDVLGKYHPHGDAAVYETLVRMVQDFSLRYPLVDGQGNFGSIDGDNAAAYRYTEARLGAAALELLADIDKETVAFAPNFDGRLAEPAVLPARLPNLLVNGSSGIAVGMSTNVPPHNVGEVAAALRYLIEHPSCTIADLTKRLPGPDFPTGGVIVGAAGIREMYETGRGRLIVRARIVKELLRSGKEQLVVTEMPYTVSKTRVIEQIAEQVREKRLDGVADLRDESDRDGIRVVIELKRGAEAEKIVARLYRHTHLQSTFGAIVLALDHGQPREFNLKQLLERWRDHRVDVVQRRSRFELERAVSERHLTEGILVAVDAIEEVVRLIRGSKDREQAAAKLRRRFKLSEAQADAILSMRFARLTGLERSELKERLRTLTREIARLEAILASERKQLQVVLAELAELVERFGDERRTEILADDEDVALEDAVASEDVVIALSHQGFVKRSRARAGRTSVGRVKTEGAGDYTERAFTARTTDRLLFFGEHGQVYSLPVLDVPEAGPASRGQLLHRLLGVRRAERIVGLTAVGDSAPEQDVLFVTVGGMTKRTPLRDVATTRAGGILAMRLQGNDRVLDVRVVDGSEDIVLVTRRGRAIRFAAGEVSVMGRAAVGVRGVRLQRDDELVGMAVARRDAMILTMTVLGLGKQTPVSEYPLQRRGGLGTQAVRASDGDVVAAFEVIGEGEVMIVTTSGEAHPVGLREIPVRRRTKPGAKVIETGEADRVTAVTRLVEGAGTRVPVVTRPEEAAGQSEPAGQLELTMSDERKR